MVNITRLDLVAHTFNPSTQEAEQAGLCEFETSLVYRMSSRTARSIAQRSPILKENKTNEQKRERERRRKGGREGDRSPVKV